MKTDNSAESHGIVLCPEALMQRRAEVNEAILGTLMN